MKKNKSSSLPKERGKKKPNKKSPLPSGHAEQIHFNRLYRGGGGATE